MTSERDRALNQAIEFIAREYRDPSLEPEGEWLPPEARKIHADLIAALSPSAQAPCGDVEEIARELSSKLGYHFGVTDYPDKFEDKEAEEIIASALRSHAVDVTDERVDAACRAYAGPAGYIPFDRFEPDAKARWRTSMRAALLAALTPRLAESSHGE